MDATVKQGQSLFDVLIEHLGGYSDIVKVCVTNDISLTDDLSIGQSITLTAVENNKTATIFGNLYSKPATALSDSDKELLEGFKIFDETFDESFN